LYVTLLIRASSSAVNVAVPKRCVHRSANGCDLPHAARLEVGRGFFEVLGRSRKMDRVCSPEMTRPARREALRS
jgi:hypothetical protein